MKPYSTDLRQRVLDALDAGMPRVDAVGIFQVSLGSLKRWLRMRRTTGDLTPQRPSGRASSITPDHYAHLRLQLEAAPDASLADHATQWNADHGTTLSTWTMARAIRRLGWSRKKKTLIASERDPWARALFALQQATFDATDLVVLDEFGSNLDMHPTHAWAPLGERALAAVPRNTPLNTTTIAALTAQGIGPALIVSGGVDQRIFAAYLEQVLAPTLRPGQVVLADNLSAHKSERAQEIIAGCGCTLVYLPPYSPDYSPIELAFAKIKTELRRAATRTREALEAAIAAALAQITAADARAFFLHCGYRFFPDLDQWFCS